MPVFTYRGTNRTGTTVTGEQLAPSKSELVNMLRKQQIKVTKMSEKGKEFNLPTLARSGFKELAVFTRQSLVMIDAGCRCAVPRIWPASSEKQDVSEGADRHPGFR